MRKTKELSGRLFGGVLAMVLAIGIFAAGFWVTSLTGYAAGQAKVTAPNGAKIRQDADTASTMVGGAEKDKVLTVLGQKQGADGYTWYQVQVNDTTTGYVRADLVEVSGDVPADGAGGGEEEPAPPANVSQVNPIGATVTGESGEIRDTASLAGQVLGTVPGGTEVTITGYLTDAEGATWFQVNYSSGETQVNGFMLQDACTPSGDLTPLGQEPAPTTPPEPEPEPEPARYEIVQKDGKWLLVDNEENPGKGLPIQELMEGYDKNAQMYRDSEANVKKQKIIIIVLVFLLVAAVAGIAFLVFKIRDTMDSQYFNEVENETLRRKNASGDTGKHRTAMHTVGPKEQQARGGSARPAGSQRPAGAADQRTAAPAGQRSAGADQRTGSVQGQRPSAARSTAARPSGSAQSTRPAGGMQGTRPSGSAQGARPTGAVQGSRPAARPSGSAQGTRPAGHPSGSVQGQRPVGAQGRRPEGAPVRPPQGARPGQKAQPKNFLSDEDEFEFEFLNYDEDDE